MVIAMSIVSVVIAVVIPIALAAFANKRFKVSWNIILYGAMAFIVAYFINLFISNQLSTMINSGSYPWMDTSWFSIVYPIIIGLMTGLLEQGANWLAFKISGAAGKSWGSALGLGIGHAGMESIYAVGIPLLLTVVQVISLQANGITSLNLSAADAASLQESLKQFYATPWHLPLVVGVDRLFWLVIQITAAVLTWLAFMKRGLYWFVAAVGLQMLATTTGMLISYTGISVWASEGIIFVIAAGSAYILFLVKTRIIDQNPDLLVAPVVPEKNSAKPIVEGKAEFLPSAPLITREPKADKPLTKKLTSKKPAAKKN
jgi:uncharacterized membrane protein YhfC